MEGSIHSTVANSTHPTHPSHPQPHVSNPTDRLEPYRDLLFRAHHHVHEWVFRRPSSKGLVPVESQSAMRYQFLRVFCIGFAIAVAVYCGFDFLNGSVDYDGGNPFSTFVPYLPLWYMCIPIIQDFTGSTFLATIVLILSVTAGVIFNTTTDDSFTLLGSSNATVLPVLATLLLGVKGGIAAGLYFLSHISWLYFQYIARIGDDPAKLLRAQTLLSGYVNNLLFNLFMVVLQDYVRHGYTQELVLLKEEAIASSRQKTQFVSLVSHELRNPLSAVLSIVDLVLNNDHHMSEDTRNSIQLVHNATEDLLRILNDILDATKLGAAKMALVNYDFDLHELAVDRCYVLSTLCADKGLEMVLDFPRTVPSKFRGDAGRIRQVMSNLITNAVKFTSTGSITVSFRVESHTPSHATIVCRVRDTGCGIPQQDQHKLFEEFSQVGHRDAPPQLGSGLGLFLVKRLVELMGGNVFMKSTPDVGSEFGFSLSLEKQVGTTVPEWEENVAEEPRDEIVEEEEGRVQEQVTWSEEVEVAEAAATEWPESPITTTKEEGEDATPEQRREKSAAYIHAQHRHRSLDMNNSTILGIIQRPFYLFSRNRRFGEYLEQMCVEQWRIERFERLEVDEEEMEAKKATPRPKGLAAELAQDNFILPRKGDDEPPAVFLVDLSPEPKAIKRGLYGLYGQVMGYDDDDDDEEDEGDEVIESIADPYESGISPIPTPTTTTWATHLRRIKTPEEQEDEILHSTLEAFTRAFMARALLGPANVGDYDDLEDDDEGAQIHFNQVRSKDTIIFFHSFRQFHRVRPGMPLCRAYNVSVCRKPVTEREVLSMIRHPRKIGGVNVGGSSGALYLPPKVLAARKSLAEAMVRKESEEGSTAWEVGKQMGKTRGGSVISTATKTPMTEAVVVVTAEDGRVRKASPTESSPKKVDSGFGIVGEPRDDENARRERKVTMVEVSEEDSDKGGRLKLRQFDARPPNSAPLPTPAATKVMGTKMPRVLVVEDNNVNRILVKQQLKSLGMRHVDIAVDGLEAVQKFTQRSDYGLILMDMHMPNCDGETATRIIRERERERQLGHRSPVSDPSPLLLSSSSASTSSSSSSASLQSSLSSFTSSPASSPGASSSDRRLPTRWDSGLLTVDPRLLTQRSPVPTPPASPTFPPRVPIIALTADMALKDDEERKHEAMKVGMDDILVKPLSLSDLSVVLQKHVLGYRPRAQPMLRSSLAMGSPVSAPSSARYRDL